MAGLGRKVFNSGDILLASEVQGYLQDQAVMVFDDSATRATAIGTANFSEGMASYLKDTDQVEVYDGSVWNSVGGDSGLVHINETSFSAVSSVSLPDNTFTTTYDSYLLVLNLGLSQSAELRFRTRLSGTDATGSNYDFHAVAFENIYASQSSNTTQSSIYAGGALVHQGAIVQLHDIALAKSTRFVLQGLGSGRTGLYSSGSHEVSTAYDSCTFFRSAGTMSGTIVALGVKK